MTCHKSYKANAVAAFCSVFLMQMMGLALLLCSSDTRDINRKCQFVVYAMSINGKRESHIKKMSSSSSYSTRARFLSSSAAAFLTASVGVIGFVGANSPDECFAAPYSIESFNDNPRYIDKELQMKYGESPGMLSYHRYIINQLPNEVNLWFNC